MLRNTVLTVPPSLGACGESEGGIQDPSVSPKQPCIILGCHVALCLLYVLCDMKKWRKGQGEPLSLSELAVYMGKPNTDTLD